VANVAVWGDRDRQLQVQIDPERLAARGVTQHQIIETAGNAVWISPLTYLEASFPGTGGWIDGPNQRLEIRHVLPLSTPADLARVTVEGSSLRLGDVANVVEGHPPLIGDALLADGPGLLYLIEKLPGPTRSRWRRESRRRWRNSAPACPAWSSTRRSSARRASSRRASVTSTRRW
jgi:multidrug efflux pump subunit AcrB